MGNVFLGGTCNDSKWRDKLIELLKPSVPYFNPVVDEWGEEDRLKEIGTRNCFISGLCHHSNVKWHL